MGPRGNRVAKVVAELGNEKVDIVRWNTDAILYISNALSPAQITKVILAEEPTGTGTATVIVSEDQQSLAIGKQGQNVRLAAKLTGWRIDIRTEKQYAEEQAKKMFALGTPAALPTRVRESEDEFAGIFPTESLETSENGAVGDQHLELGQAAPDPDEGTNELTPSGESTLLDVSGEGENALTSDEAAEVTS